MSRMMKTVPLVVLCALIILVPSVWAFWVQDGVALCTATGDQWCPTIIADGAGGAFVTWYDYRSGNADIYAQRVNASGAVYWTANGVAVCTAPEDQFHRTKSGDPFHPTIASDGAGGVIIPWYDYRSGNADIYAQRVNASGVVQWTADGVALCTATGEQSAPAIVSDGAGGGIIMWQDMRSGNYDIYVQRVNASGAVQWMPNGVALSTAAGYQCNPTILSDGAGGAIVTWRDYRMGNENWDIYAQRVNASGAVQWTANGVALCTAAGNQLFPTIVSDDAGGAIITWADMRPGSSGYDIYAQRVNASGAVRWTTDGVALCTATSHQQFPEIVSDGAGGAIVTWYDARNGPGCVCPIWNWDIYAQRVNASGAVQWTNDGVALCTAPGDQVWPMIVSDGAGGAIVTWYDYQSANDDIHAQRVNASGAIQWTANGVPLCAATGDQEFPEITSDGAGGAIVTWQDYRSGSNYDIYAQRIDAGGNAPIATLLQCYSSSLSDHGITVAWTLSEMDPDVEFFILREAQGASDFDQLSAVDLAREGLSFEFVDSDVESGTTYTYRVDIQMGSERKTLFETGPIKAPAMPLTLFQNSPNPFNPSTEIRYYLPEKCSVALDICDVNGALVTRLTQGYREKGSHTVTWDGRDRDGRQVNSGVYFYHLKAGKAETSKKMVLAR